MKARLVGAMAILGVLMGILVVTVGGVASAASRSRDVASRARPGARAISTSRARIASGTARNTSSRVWFTVADGVLSDTYWPTVDATNVHTLQYLVTGSAAARASPTSRRGT